MANSAILDDMSKEEADKTYKLKCTGGSESDGKALYKFKNDDYWDEKDTIYSTLITCANKANEFAYEKSSYGRCVDSA